eukprot:520517_1
MNLNNIVVFWNYIENIQLLRKLFKYNKDILFFDLDILFNLFPNLEQIEYFNESLQNQNISLVEKQIRAIFEYIVACHANKNNLKYAVFHHKVSTKFDLIMAEWVDKDWKMKVDQKRIILYKTNIDIHYLNLRFNERRQGNATNNMLTNLFS